MSWLARLRGVVRAVRHPVPIAQTPFDVIHTENKWRLLRYRGAQAPTHRLPILMVPSLINRHYVLDLSPGKSFVEWLVAQGHDVFIIDWGTPSAEDRYLTFEDIVVRYLRRALDRTCRAAGTDQTHVLGYCLGGTLVAMHAALDARRIASFLALAAPVHFCPTRDDSAVLESWAASPAFDAAALARCGNIPWPLMQFAFHAMQPMMNPSKAVGFVDRCWQDSFVDGFMAVERWSNDNVDFPAEAFRQYIVDLYQRDALYRGEMRLAGQPVRLDAIACPLMVVTFEHDGIVPRASAEPLFEQAGSPDKVYHHANGGHVGAVVSRSAAKRLWPKLSAFFLAHEAAA
jgi:polyhydroxyalkanoate synthase